jgi:hypothetical protein
VSTILKALRRLEREKSEQSDQSLSEAVTHASPPPSRRRGRWLVVAGLLVGAIAIAAVVFPMLPAREEVEEEAPVEIAATPPERSPARPTPRRRRSSARKPAPTTPEPGSPARAPATGGRVVPRPQPKAPPDLPPAALSSEVEVVKRIRPAEPAEQPRPAEPETAGKSPRSEHETVQPAPTSGSARRDAEAPKPGTRRPAVPEAPEEVQIASVAPAAKPPATPRAESEPQPAPRAAEPGAILRSPVPNVYVARTIWHPLAERRIAVVELEGRAEALELHEGDAVGPLVVGKIEPSGVFFVHDGVELRRRVGAR